MEPKLRIGLYVCHCGLNIAGVISPEALTVQGQILPEVAVCRHHLYTCSRERAFLLVAPCQHFFQFRLALDSLLSQAVVRGDSNQLKR